MWLVTTPEIGGVFAQALERSLADLGHVQGRNIVPLHRFAGPQPDKIQEVIISLVPPQPIRKDLLDVLPGCFAVFYGVRRA
jgi:hypothetical protein